MRILNLYAGIGGNRKLWGDKHDITAVEINKDIAAIYQRNFPNDKVIIADAHAYLEKNYQGYDFIWASPPCQSHSRLNNINFSCFDYTRKYADMKLWQEIIFLQMLSKFSGINWIVENVIPYYKSFITPTAEIGRHYFWSNKFFIAPQFKKNKRLPNMTWQELLKLHGFKDFKIKNKRQILRNCVNPEIAEYVFKEATKC